MKNFFSKFSQVIFLVFLFMEFKGFAGDRSVVYSVACRSADEPDIAVGGDSKTFSLYLYNGLDSLDVKIDRDISSDNSAVVNSLAWSSTGRFLAVGGTPNDADFSAIKIYSFENFDDGDSDLLTESFWDESWSNRNANGPDVRCLDWNKPTNSDTDPTYLTVVGEFDSTHEKLTIYQLNGASSLTEKVTQDYGTYGPVNCVNWRPGYDQLVVGGFNLDGSSDLILYSLFGSTLNIGATKDFTSTSAEAVRTLDWHPDGNYVAVAFIDRIYIFDSSLNEVLPFPYYLKLSNEDHYINSIKWRSDGNYLLIGLENNPEIKICAFENETLSLSETNSSYGGEIKSVDWVYSLGLSIIGGDVSGDFSVLPINDVTFNLPKRNTVDWYVSDSIYAAVVDDSVSCTVNLMIYKLDDSSLVPQVSLNDLDNTPTFVRWRPGSLDLVVIGNNLFGSDNVRIYQFDNSNNNLRKIFSDKIENIFAFDWFVDGEDFAFSVSNTLYTARFDDSNVNNWIYNDWNSFVNCGSKINVITCGGNGDYIIVGCDHNDGFELQIYLLDEMKILSQIDGYAYSGNVNTCDWSSDNFGCYCGVSIDDIAHTVGTAYGNISNNDYKQSWTLNYKNSMKGMSSVEDTLYFGNDAKAVIEHFGSVGNIVVNDSVITLSKDFNITGTITDVDKTLTILGDGHVVNLFQNQTFENLSIIGKNAILDCHNKSITLNGYKTLIAAKDSILHLKNCTININHENGLFLGTENSKIILENCILNLLSNCSVEKGALEFRGNIAIQSNGEKEFFWSGGGHVIKTDSVVKFYSDVSIIMQPLSSSVRFLTFEDNKSKLIFDGITVFADEDIKATFFDGNFIIKNNVTISSIQLLTKPKLNDSNLIFSNIPYVVDWSSTGSFLAVGGDPSSTQYAVKVYKYENEHLLLTSSIYLNGYANSLAWSPDENYLAVADVVSHKCKIYSFNGETISLFDSIGFGGECYDVTWSPTGNYLAISGNNIEEHVQIYRLDMNNVEKVDSLANTFARVIDWDPLGAYLAIGYGTKNEDDVFAIYEFDFTNELLSTSTVAYDTAGTSSINSVKWSHDGNYIVIGQDNGFVRVFDFNRTSPAVTELDSVVYENRIDGISWSYDDTHLAFYTGDNQFEIYQFNGSLLSYVYGTTT